jgi:adenosylcobyric acid synthase
MLGAQIDDAQGVEGGTPGGAAGLGLLPLVTRFEPGKHLARTAARFDVLRGPWAPLAGLAVEGYEIRAGRSAATDPSLAPALVAAQAGGPRTIGWQRGTVLALTLHGLFENPAVVRALFGATLQPLDAVFDGLADMIDASLGTAVVDALLAPTPEPLKRPPAAGTP